MCGKERRRYGEIRSMQISELTFGAAAGKALNSVMSALR